MGEARRRGNFEERRKVAIQRNKTQLMNELGERDPVLDDRLRAGIAPFLARLGRDAWSMRRAAIIESLKGMGQGIDLEKAHSIRVREDEVGWYLFLAEQALNDPMCIDVAQAQRSLPYFVGIGSRWFYAPKVRGLDEKLDEILHTYKSSPDGGIFEISVALAYASKGWDVEFIPTQRGAQIKTADMVVRKNGSEIYVECKRQDRRAAYAEAERNEFLRLWDATVPVLMGNGQWIWVKGVFHTEIASLPTSFLANIFQSRLPINSREALIYDGDEATLHARIIDHSKVCQHFLSYRVKANSPMLNKVIGGDWAPKNAAVTMVKLIKSSQVVDCEVPLLGTYIDQVDWACGFTRDIDAEISIDKKARDIKKLLADAVKQVPTDKASVIHIAAETLEGRDVERRRTQKVMESIPNFVTEKPVFAVRFHRFQPNHAVDLLFEFDETVETFTVDGAPLTEIPANVVIPDGVQMQHGSHWELYQDD